LAVIRAFAEIWSGRRDRTHGVVLTIRKRLTDRRFPAFQALNDGADRDDLIIGGTLS
jgi:hypothetical protein